MIEVLLNQMLPIVLPQHLNLAAKLVVRALDELIFTDFLVLLHILPERLLPTVVLTFNDLEKAPLIVRLQILDHNHRATSLVGTSYLPERTVLQVHFKISAQ